MEGSPTEMEQAAKDPIVLAKLGGMNVRHAISTCMAAMPVDANGVPFDCSHIYATGNAAADMLANVTAESTGRMLAVQLYRLTDDPGMKDMLKFLIARDTMHQNQWLAAWEELGGHKAHPIPTNFPQEEENSDVNYTFMSFGADGVPAPAGRWSEGPSFDGRGKFTVKRAVAMGEVPDLGPGAPVAAVQLDQQTVNPGAASPPRR